MQLAELRRLIVASPPPPPLPGAFPVPFEPLDGDCIRRRGLLRFRAPTAASAVGLAPEPLSRRPRGSSRKLPRGERMLPRRCCIAARMCCILDFRGSFLRLPPAADRQ